MTKAENDKKPQRTITPPRKVSVGQFAEETRHEWRKITWPDRNTVVKASTVILVIVVLSTAFVGGFDALYSKLFLILKGL